MDCYCGVPLLQQFFSFLHLHLELTVTSDVQIRFSRRKMVWYSFQYFIFRLG
eukprot:m.581118 g.581118  ORF g.581118 m.581118 type:complete len:52 (-) comp22326_c1_seq17:453-608(-)